MEWDRVMHIHTDIHRRHAPGSVNVFAMHEGNIMWVRHPVRGWEVPGGKLEPGETPQEAIDREAFEEAGLLLSRHEWLGEYQIRAVTGEYTYKWIFCAQVARVLDRPTDYEIVDCRFAPLYPPASLLEQGDVSPFMKDMVYATVYPLVAAKLAARAQAW